MIKACLSKVAHVGWLELSGADVGAGIGGLQDKRYERGPLEDFEACVMSWIHAANVEVRKVLCGWILLISALGLEVFFTGLNYRWSVDLV